MKDCELLHDTGRLVLALRLPVALIGILLLWFSAHDLCSHLFGYDLGLDSTNESGSPVVGFLATLGLGLFFLSFWFMRNQFFWDAARREVLVRHTGLFGKTTRRISLANATGVSLRFGKLIASQFWELGIEFEDGKREWLTRVYENEGEVANKFSKPLGLPVSRVF